MNLKRLFFVLLAMFAMLIINAKEVLQVNSYKEEVSSILFECENGQTVKLSLVTDDMIRFQVSNDGQFDESKMEQFGFVKNDFSPVDYELTETDDAYTVSTSSIDVKMTKASLAMTVFDKGGNLVLRQKANQAFEANAQPVLNFDMPADEHFFGFGFMRETLDARGHKLTFKREFRWKGATLPYFMSTRGYAFYSNSVFNQDFDFTSKVAVGDTDFYSIKANGGKIDFYIIYGPDFPKLLNNYTDLTGKSMMVPKWAFGLEYRLRYYGDQEELMNVAKEFRNKEIPCDIMALEPGWEQTAYSMNWQFSKERFPDPEQMVADLSDMGFQLDLWESGLAPMQHISKEKTRKDWYKQRKKTIDMGVKMFKQDDPYPRSITSSELLDPTFANKTMTDNQLTEEEMNNVSNSLYTETLFEEYRKQTNERAVVMFHAYNASVASHRWPFQWAGDFQAENGMLNASLSGHAMVSYDIRNPYAAGWHQGFFTPFTVVDSWAYYRDPWLYSETIEQSHRTYACLRSRLVPYLYSSLWQSHTVGLPIERPMVLEYHNDPVTHQMKSQFMVGDWLLLALSDVDDSPAGEKIDFWTGVQKGNVGRAYLPKGEWIDYWTGEVRDVKKAYWQESEWPDPLGGPLYVKAGAIIPMTQVKNYVTETTDDILVLDVYPHSSEKSSYQVYEDDGATYAYEKNEYAITDISCERTETKVTVDIAARQGEYNNMPEHRSYLLKLHSVLSPTAMIVDGEKLDFYTDKAALIYGEVNGWYYDAKEKKAIVKLDKGWNYVMTEKGNNPIATIPLTAKNERVNISNATMLNDAARRIEMLLPQQAVATFTSNIAALPADAYSIANVEMTWENIKGKLGMITLKVDGSATFVNGKREMIMDASKKSSFTLKATGTPGQVKVTVSGSTIEKALFSLPVYGKAVSLHVETTNTVLVADGANKMMFRASLHDADGRKVLIVPHALKVNVTGEAVCEMGASDTMIHFVNGIAEYFVKSTNNTGSVAVTSSYDNLKSKVSKLSSKAGVIQVRINPPEKIKLDSQGSWIPDQVDVFVNFRADGRLVKNSSNAVTLNVYDKQNVLLATYVQNAKKGEVIFKDITYYTRPAQCLFEIKCDGYDDVTRRVFDNTWDLDPNAKVKADPVH